MKKLRIAVIVMLILAIAVTWGDMIAQILWPHMIHKGNTENALAFIVIAFSWAALVLDIVYSASERRILMRKRKRFDNPAS